MIEIILIEPETAGNIGAVARVMKNFGFPSLTLIDPKCDHLEKEALDRSTHAKDILKKAKIKKRSYLKRFDYIIGTTAILGTDYNIPRSPLTPKELSHKLNSSAKDTKIALIFGRESTGLTNSEIEACDFMVTIPATKEYPTLNISHSVSIILYELFKQKVQNKSNSHIAQATKKEKDVLFEKIDEIIKTLHFSTPEKRETQKTVWKRIIGKSLLTKREAFALLGFFKKVIEWKKK